jgi:hypothetical protein
MIIKTVPKRHHQRLSGKGWRGTVSHSATDSRGGNTVKKGIYCPVFFYKEWLYKGRDNLKRCLFYKNTFAA